MNLVRVWIKDNSLSLGSAPQKAPIDLWVETGNIDLAEEISVKGLRYEMKGDDKGVIRFIPPHQILTIYYYGKKFVAKDNEAMIMESHYKLDFNATS